MFTENINFAITLDKNIFPVLITPPYDTKYTYLEESSYSTKYNYIKNIIINYKNNIKNIIDILKDKNVEITKLVGSNMDQDIAELSVFINIGGNTAELVFSVDDSKLIKIYCKNKSILESLNDKFKDIKIDIKYMGKFLDVIPEDVFCKMKDNPLFQIRFVPSWYIKKNIEEYIQTYLIDDSTFRFILRFVAINSHTEKNEFYLKKTIKEIDKEDITSQYKVRDLYEGLELDLYLYREKSFFII